MVFSITEEKSMKQGSGKSSHSAGKVEPKPMAVHPGYAGQLGIAQGNHVTEIGTVKGGAETMHAGRGFKAPTAGEETHHCGSQGRHK